MYKTLPIIALVVSVVAVATLIPLTSQAFLGPVWVPFSGGCFSGWWIRRLLWRLRIRWYMGVTDTHGRTRMAAVICTKAPGTDADRPEIVSGTAINSVM